MTRKISMEKQDEIYFRTIKWDSAAIIAKELNINPITVSSYRVKMKIDKCNWLNYL